MLYHSLLPSIQKLRLSIPYSIATPEDCSHSDIRATVRLVQLPVKWLEQACIIQLWLVALLLINILQLVPWHILEYLPIPQVIVAHAPSACLAM